MNPSLCDGAPKARSTTPPYLSIKNSTELTVACMISIILRHAFSVVVQILNFLARHSCKSCIPTSHVWVWGREDLIAFLMEPTRTLGQGEAITAGVPGKDFLEGAGPAATREEQDRWDRRIGVNNSLQAGNAWCAFLHGGRIYVCACTDCVNKYLLST